jgi:Ca-activated chloride channel family protein
MNADFRKAIIARAALLVGLCLGSGAGLFGDGFIIPKQDPHQEIPPLTVKYHRVQVEVDNQVARTSVDQVFINNYGRDIEGTYIFPLPEGASINEFAMYIGSERVQGEILDAAQARRIYEDIVRRLRDPGLLEYIGRNMFRARVFPIPARGEKRIQISYTEILRSERGLVRYVYPLDTERFSREPLRELSLSVRVESKVPIASVYSPTHMISVRKEGPGLVRAGYEAADIKPDKDFVLYYGLSQDDVGLSFLNSEGPDGKYFMFLAAPRYAGPKEKVINKNIVLVLDSSGSMSGAKIAQAKAAARFIIGHLDPADRFSIIDFDDGVNALSEELLPAGAANGERALKFVDAIEDSGGTNIHQALLAALAMLKPGERPNYVLFLTDGQPTVGTTDPAEILKAVGDANGARARLFVFGVGTDVNTELLDGLSARNRGTPIYVGTDEDLEVAISGFYEKISSPLLADLSLKFQGIEVRDLYPRTLPDLFKGSQLVVIGRYEGDGPAAAVLSGTVGPAGRTFRLEGQALARGDEYLFLPRLWATRRVGDLLEQIRLHGADPELVAEVKKLGLKFGIVTPYTSYLVTEKEQRVMEAAAPAARDAMKTRATTGAGAVMVAKVSQRLKAGEQAAQAESTQIRYKDDKTFYLKDGVWTDSEYAAGDAVQEVGFNSDAYFKLIADKPSLAKYLSVADKMVVCFAGVNYRIF